MEKRSLLFVQAGNFAAEEIDLQKPWKLICLFRSCKTVILMLSQLFRFQNYFYQWYLYTTISFMANGSLIRSSCL